MYVDSRPVSTFGETQGWKMPTPQPAGSLKRPPILRNGSSSSSLSGMEQATPSFQNFLRRTPPLEQQKPLPPTPLIPRRASSSSPPQSLASSFYGARRSSSVYSRTVSQWVPDSVSIRSLDFADAPMPLLPTLQPVAYSASTPQLIERRPTPRLLLPRKYSPLIMTPSPTVSRSTTPSPPPRHEALPSTSTPPSSVQATKKKMRIVSLDKAKAAVHSPGAIHLLPEELRAQTFGRSKSHEPLRAGVPEAAPMLPSPTVLTDHEGRQRAVESPVNTLAAATESPFPVVSPWPTKSFKVGTGPERLMVPLASPRPKPFFDSATQQPAFDRADEPRGRTMQRGSRRMQHAEYVPKERRASSSPPPKMQGNTQNMATEYRTLLAQPRGQPSGSASYPDTDSDNRIRTHMKMVPQPLFQNKHAAKLPGSVPTQASNTSVSPYHLEDEDVFGSDGRRRSTYSHEDSFPPYPSSETASTHRRRSTSGSIPISPPTVASPIDARPMQPGKAKKRNDARASAYYPHIAPRKGKKVRSKRSSNPKPPPMPRLAADLLSQLRPPKDTSVPSPNKNGSPAYLSDADSSRKGSNASAHEGRLSLHQRLAKGAVKYADLLTRPQETTPRRRSPADAAQTLSSDSLHSLSSPEKSPDTEVHLGWSDYSKTTFDNARSSLNSQIRSPTKAEAPQFTHVAAPARPLDASRHALNELESPRRKSSIFGGMLDTWKESRAERRREELKKIIKVVPQDAVQPPVENGRRMSTFVWM